MPGPEAHLELVGKFERFWRTCINTESCFICIVQIATITMICDHRFCDSYIIVCGSSTPSNPWRYQVFRCLLYQKFDGKIISLRPPTAGLKILNLNCLIQSRLSLFKFLEELQSYVGLTGLSLREHFNIAIGTNIGMTIISYFASNI